MKITDPRTGFVLVDTSRHPDPPDPPPAPATSRPARWADPLEGLAADRRAA